MVRLVRGELTKEQVYHDNPAEIARGFAAAGAVRLHVVDLEGAFQGSQKNLKSIQEITAAVNLEVQVGGGVRNLTVAGNLFDAGVKRVILGTAVVEEPALAAKFLEEFGPERVIIAVDARDGFVAVKGWVESSGWDALEFARKMQALGALEIVYTDISRDGTLAGPNLPALQRMAEYTELSVIASGGISSLEDIQAVQALGPLGVTGVIIGQALYTGKFTLEEALKAASDQ